jgi:hypothetical protein
LSTPCYMCSLYEHIAAEKPFHRKCIIGQSINLLFIDLN